MFNARRGAQNFNEQELCEAVRYCRICGVKVYAALNILVKDTELKELDKSIIALANAGADAVIVQDLAVASRVKQLVPGMKLHGSTQMSVHNAAGVKELERMGFARAVLARELSLKEIRAIAAQTDTELEVFVHGAHCMSVSGQCYMSSVFGGRSGNRGCCAQPCRLDFYTEQRRYALSLKDMCCLDKVRELNDTGVASFKIEGRMKRPEYVAAAVTASKNALEGKEYDEQTLKAVFSRSGFTEGYLTAKSDLSMFGVRTKEDVTASSGALSGLRALYAKQTPLVGIKTELTLREGEPALLNVSARGACVSVSGEVPGQAHGAPLDDEYAAKFLKKTGGTPFFTEQFNTRLGSGLYMPGAQLNDMRRRALEQLSEQLAKREPYKIKACSERRCHLTFSDKTNFFVHCFSVLERLYFSLL